MYLLDSDIVVWILRKNQAIISSINKLIEEDTTGVSTITILEIYKNVFPKEISDVEEFFKKQKIIPVTAQIAKDGGWYWQQFHKRLKNLNILDCIIASTAKDQKAKLVTLNTRHFPMSDIKIIDPLKN